MTNPTLGWIFSAPSPFTIAGATPTVAEMLAGLEAAITADATLWEVSDYSAVNGTLEVKRSGSPVGELATVRMLFFGGSAPHASALSVAHTAGGTTTLYAGMSIDAATTGPTAAYTAGAPYATKYVRAGSITAAAAIAAASSPRITLIESEDAFGFTLGDTAGTASYIGGRIIVRGSDDTLVWGSMPSGGVAAVATVGSGLSSAQAHILTPFTSASNLIKANYWDTISAASRFFGRMLAGTSITVDSGLGASGNAACLIPVPVGEAIAVANSTVTYFGFLRQMRLGPTALHLAQLLNGASVLQATHCGALGAVASIGGWFDEVA